MSTTFTNQKSDSGFDHSETKGRSAHSFVVPTVLLLSVCVLSWVCAGSTVFGQQRSHPYKAMTPEIVHTCPAAAEILCKQTGGLPE
jgi:hypothetical protein